MIYFASKSNVDVWLTTASGFQVTTATGFSIAELQTGIIRALTIWNEDGGTNIKLRYRGTTTQTEIAGAIVVYGNIDDYSTGIAFAHPVLVNDQWVRGSIEIRGYFLPCVGNVCSPDPAPISWCQTIGACTDFVTVMVHELGHVAFNMAHPDDGPPERCENVGAAAMLSTVTSRELRPYDLEIAQRRYGPRSQLVNGQSSKIFRTQPIGPTSWGSSGEVSDTGSYRPLYRMGGMSSVNTIRALGFVSGGQTTQDGGSGTVLGITYSTGNTTAQSQGTYASNQTRGRTIAIAAKPETETLIVYFKLDNLYPSDYVPVCYRRSTNSGVSYGSETCLTTGAFNTGISATYDPTSDSFLIGLRAASNGSLAIFLLTIPTIGGTTPITLTNLGASSFHAPSIACSGRISGCVVAYESAQQSAFLSWLRVEVSPTTGVATVQSSLSQGLIIYDMPSVVWSEADSTYRLVNTIANSAAYSYKMTANGTTWTGTGDVFNNAVGYISTVNLSTRFRSESDPSRLYAWYFRYW